jgi:hypothetical protein
MAGSSGGGGFGWFIVGALVGAAAVSYGPTTYQKYVVQGPTAVRVEVGGDYTPGVWRRSARIDVEFSRYKANGQNWDWPMIAPELQVCIREGSEYRKCLGPQDAELAPCQGRFRCTTGVIRLPDVPFTIELNEWDDYNKPDPIGTADCDIGQTCKFPLGSVTIRDAGPVPAVATAR